MTAGVHPEPTPGTVKRLYARAFRCARPDCSRPLYKQDNDTGDLVLNSRVAHIHARRRGGARWIEMSVEDNRADANLLLLCIEHSYEIDELPDLYPAELLREWKQAQLDEHEQAQRGWPLTDADAGRVLEASSRAVEHHHAGAVLGAVRAAERLALAARGARRGPAGRAATWRAARAMARGACTAWDQDGNALHAEPSRQETEQHKAALLAALREAVEVLAPLADEAKVELAAVRASRPAVEPWSAWASGAVDDVVAMSATWPGPPELEDDDRLDDALSGLAEATDALAAAWRGDPAAPPPPPEPDRAPPPVPRDPLEDHRALLDRARPYARVDHRRYDAALRAELAAAAERAAGIPPVPSARAVGLSATCRLAAAVAGNADDDELAALTEQDVRRRPLSAAVLLLDEAARVAEKRGRPGPQERAEAALAALWDSIDWSNPGSWDPDDANGQSVLWAGSRITSPEQVKQRLSQALARRSDVVLPLVAACADWEESRDRETWRVLGFRRRYRELPAWFPGQAVVAAAASAPPNAESVVVDAFGETDGDDADSLLAQVLWLVQRSTA
ncbi:hypothetical protein [Geodermatophilus obscurus]|uniref:hypothetical protein n=1 Tax=Geodermatophilus obscurus TaxID=1861 RepID=UPI001140DBE5|nr:hypothetical protein [Geodermatophilus obscurus]